MNELHAQSDIENLAVLEGEHDGWNINSVITLLQHRSHYILLTQDFDMSTIGWMEMDIYSTSTLTLPLQLSEV